MITVNLLVAFNLAGVPKAKQVLSSDSIATKMWLSLQSWWRSFSLRWGSSVTENQQHQDIKCILSSKRIFRWFGEVWCYSGVLATKLPIMGKSPVQSSWICPKLTGTWEIMIFNDPWLRNCFSNSELSQPAFWQTPPTPKLRSNVGLLG